MAFYNINSKIRLIIIFSPKVLLQIRDLSFGVSRSDSVRYAQLRFQMLHTVEFKVGRARGSIACKQACRIELNRGNVFLLPQQPPTMQDVCGV